MAMINLAIDERKVSAPAGSTVLQAATQAGIKIPTLCDHPALAPIGACRMCLVEIKGQRTLQPACTFPITEGMEVQTYSPAVIEARRFVLELLLSDHPLDCMTCDSTGSCELQDLMYEYGVKETRFPGYAHEYPVEDPNPFIKRDYNKCILCRRCVRACEEINGVEAIGMVWRGFRSKPGTAFDGNLEDSPCEFCGMCVAVCPTGALQSKMALGKGRVWQMEKVTTTCPYCGVGCQIDYSIRDGQIVQAESHWDGPPSQGWTCVKGRFGFDYVNHPDRLTQPLIKKDGHFVEASWDEALDLIADKMVETKKKHGGDAIAVLSSAKCTNEENYLLQKFTRAVLETNNVDHCARL
jgi:predicted molibdopterin-dependent oxidoreductase YjgC